MKTFFCTAALSLFALTAPTFAESTSDAEKLVDIAFNSSAMEGARAAFSPFLEQARKQGVPEAGLKEMAAAADVFFSKTFSDPDLHKEIAKLYEAAYTAEELHGILEFYNTPLGQKSLKIMPQIGQKATMLGQQFAGKNQEAFQGELRAILQRYPKPTSAPEGAPAAPPAAPATPDKK